MGTYSRILTSNEVKAQEDSGLNGISIVVTTEYTINYKVTIEYIGLTQSQSSQIVSKGATSLKALVATATGSTVSVIQEPKETTKASTATPTTAVTKSPTFFITSTAKSSVYGKFAVTFLLSIYYLVC